MLNFFRRFLVAAVMVAVSYFLQNGLFTSALYFQTMPNLLLVTAVIFGFSRGPYVGAVIGFICGLLSDLHSGSVLGMYALSYLYAGLIGGVFSRFFYLDELGLPIVLCGAADFIHGLYTFFCRCLLYNRTDFMAYLRSIILPEVVYTMVTAIFLYRMIQFLNKRCEEAEQRSARRFV